MDLSTELSLKLDPSLIMDFQPDPWQRDLLRSQATRLLLLCSRQLGKSTAVACVALNEAYLNDDATVLLVSRSERQAELLFRKVSRFHKAVNLVQATKELALSLELTNGSEVVALPGDADTIRGFSAPRLIIIDEASRVRDDVLAAVLPMLIANKGRLLALSTPCGMLGWFYEKWSSADPAWQRINAKASESPRISAEALAEQLASLGSRLYAQEFDNQFLESTGQCFATDVILAAFDCDDEPLFGGSVVREFPGGVLDPEVQPLFEGVQVK